MATGEHSEDCTCSTCYLNWLEVREVRRTETLFCIALCRTLDTLNIAKVTKEYNRLRDDRDEADRLISELTGGRKG